ncbi:hypothetical protein [Actinomadura gamaensis]|uniref:Uncharacterized protein n=1 Tax=Actinomadura gamaensis TaxID=1763541 RepID=A0ABV9TQR1_9ACTN
MALRFYGKGNPTDQCPAVFWDPAAEHLYFQGDTVTAVELPTETGMAGRRSPVEAVVSLPPRMAAIILEAARECVGTHDEIVADAVDRRSAAHWDAATERFYFRGNAVTAPAILSEVAAHSPMLPGESVVALPPHAAVIVMEVVREFLASHPDVVQRPVEEVPAVRSETGTARRLPAR